MSLVLILFSPPRESADHTSGGFFDIQLTSGRRVTSSRIVVREFIYTALNRAHIYFYKYILIRTAVFYSYAPVYTYRVDANQRLGWENNFIDRPKYLE